MTAREFPVLIGLHTTDVYKILGEFRIPYRVARMDDTYFKMSPEYKSNRVNLYIKQSVVEDARYY